MKIAVFMGGISSEREVSLRSGAAILVSLQRQGYDAYGVDLTKETLVSSFITNEYDLAYIALHGEYGEDGRVQALLDMLDKPYTGSGVTSSAIAMDKIYTKKLAELIGIRVPRTYKNLEEISTYPVIIKPATEGSSVGLFICNDESDVKKATEELKGKKLVIEEYIQGEELTVGVFDEEALGVTKIIPRNKFYDYDAKYSKGGSVHEYPAKIEKSIYDEICKWSQDIHKELGLIGISRSDFMLKDGKAYFLEVNTCPGMTETSLIPELGTLKGYTFDNLIKKMVERAKKI